MSTLPRMWRDRVRATPTSEAFRHRADAQSWVSVTWRQADDRVRTLAAGLLARGVQPGDRVAIWCRTRVEWVLLLQAIAAAGAVVTTIYPSSLASEARYILDDAGCRWAFVERTDHAEALGGWPGEVIGVDALGELEDLGARALDADPGAVDRAIDAVRADALATLIYTSGTTGPPKGVMLTHDSWAFQAEAARTTLASGIGAGELVYLFLPLAHSFGMACAIGAAHLGVPLAVEADLDAIVAGLVATRPTTVPAVPRVFEKIHHRIEARAKAAGPRRYAVFRWASAIGDEVVRIEQAGGRVGPWLRARHQIADRLVFARLRAALGGRVRVMASGGAPLAEPIARFFAAAGITVVEGYGLTETSAAAVANRPDDHRFGTVGRPVVGCELQLAPDGEVLLRGRNVMAGYWNRPEATSEVLGPDGWLHTGDLGRLDPSGRLVLTGRKKDLIVTSGGKNVAPADAEGRIKGACPLVSEIVTIGDRRPYCVALVWLDLEVAAGVAAELGWATADPAAFAVAEPLRDLVWAEVEKVNRGLPPYATVKRIHLVAEPLTSEGGLLTPSLKVKRSAVAERYAALLERSYRET